MAVDVKQIGEKVAKESEVLDRIRSEIRKVIVGQEMLVERLLVGLLCNHHVLIEGVPGLAKTLSVTTLAKTIQATYQRIQFTPDLLPADLIGTLIYNPKSGDFTTKKGPIFANVILADEINRAPAKVQSALLEAMQERQVTIGEETHKLDEPFMVLATQNPIEQEGTYPLPEAQVDRFMLKLKITYPSKDQEKQILRAMATSKPQLEVEPILQPSDIVRLRELADEIYMDEKIEDYIVSITQATRTPKQYNLDIEDLILYGASPRATIFLTMAAKANALLEGRGYVTPQDVKTIGMDVLRHRVIISYEAEAEADFQHRRSAMIPKELAKKIRYLQIRTSKAVNDVLAGQYESVFKGRGMEFDEVREYQPGDDIRTIDWNVTARVGHPYVKRYVEERELTVIFLVDLSASGAFGSVKQTKNEVAAELCALLAFAAIKNNDKVGLIVFTNRVEMFIPPKKGLSHVLRVIRELLYFKPQQVQTDIADGLDYLGRVTSKRSVIFLISDFQGEGFEKPMRVLGRKHDLVAVTITDPREIRLPNVGLLELEDAETGEIILVDTSSARIRKRYEQMGFERTQQLKELFTSMGIDQITISTGKDYVRDLVRFFLARERRR